MNNYSVLFSSDIFPFLFVKLSRLSSTILHQQILSPLLLLLLIYLTCAVLCLFTQSCPTLCNPMECSLPDILAQGDSPGKNNGGGSLSLLQGIFLTQESNQDLLHCRHILYQLSYEWSPRRWFGLGLLLRLWDILIIQVTIFVVFPALGAAWQLVW